MFQYFNLYFLQKADIFRSGSRYEKWRNIETQFAIQHPFGVLSIQIFLLQRHKYENIDEPDKLKERI